MEEEARRRRCGSAARGRRPEQRSYEAVLRSFAPGLQERVAPKVWDSSDSVAHGHIMMVKGAPQLHRVACYEVVCTTVQVLYQTRPGRSHTHKSKVK